MQLDATDEGTEPPKLPWFATIIILAVIFIVALIKPFAPYGFAEFGSRILGRPLALDLGQGRSVRLTEERAINPACQNLMDLRWKPDGAAIVADCINDLHVWTLDGHQLVA
jgi:hypothetical protein